LRAELIEWIAYFRLSCVACQKLRTIQAINGKDPMERSVAMNSA
jgi:hypothetical protein